MFYGFGYDVFVMMFLCNSSNSTSFILYSKFTQIVLNKLLLWKFCERKPTSCDNEVLHSFRQWVDDENNKNRGKPKKRKRNDETSNGD